MRWIRAQNAQGPCRLPAGDVIRSLGHAIAICDSGRQAVGSHRLLASTNRIGQTLRRWGWLHPWESKYLAKLWLVGKVASLIGLYNPRRWYPGWFVKALCRYKTSTFLVSILKSDIDGRSSLWKCDQKTFSPHCWAYVVYWSWEPKLKFSATATTPPQSSLAIVPVLWVNSINPQTNESFIHSESIPGPLAVARSLSILKMLAISTLMAIQHRLDWRNLTSNVQARVASSFLMVVPKVEVATPYWFKLTTLQLPRLLEPGV